MTGSSFLFPIWQCWPAVPRCRRTGSGRRGSWTASTPPRWACRATPSGRACTAALRRGFPALIARSIALSHGAGAERDAARRQRFDAAAGAAEEEGEGKVEDEDEDETSGVQGMMAAGIRAAFEGDGARAVAQDISLALGRWGFDLRDVEMEKGRLVLWHRAKNARNPIDVAVKAHTQLRGSELRVSDGEGRPGLAMVTRRIGEILDTLKERVAF
jgi:hypothetical protein